MGIPLTYLQEKTSLFSYKEFSDDFSWLTDKLVTMKARQNNRDGATLRIAATKAASKLQRQN